MAALLCGSGRMLGLGSYLHHRRLELDSIAEFTAVAGKGLSSRPQTRARSVRIDAQGRSQFACGHTFEFGEHEYSALVRIERRQKSTEVRPREDLAAVQGLLARVDPSRQRLESTLTSLLLARVVAYDVLQDPK